MVLGAVGKALNEVFMPTAAWELIPLGKGAKILKKGGEALGVVKKGEKAAEAIKPTKPIDNAGSGGHVKKPKSLREAYLGRTPGKESRTGKEVQDRMRKEGKLRDGPDGPEFKASNDRWYPLKDADMAHRTDAVKWWNETGRQYGAKSPEVRDWMLDSKNYTLDLYSINRSKGAQLPDRYLPPLQ
ncbi:MAG: HNH/ENDO VII family nuclease [Sterolibacteriaceae bacterium]|nr:HNH/ENDO VII family nuclease [Candidatus Methylophosphatis haderslevensis]